MRRDHWGCLSQTQWYLFWNRVKISFVNLFLDLLVSTLGWWKCFTTFTNPQIFFLRIVTRRLNSWWLPAVSMGSAWFVMNSFTPEWKSTSWSNQLLNLEQREKKDDSKYTETIDLTNKQSVKNVGIWYRKAYLAICQMCHNNCSKVSVTVLKDESHYCK